VAGSVAASGGEGVEVGDAGRLVEETGRDEGLLREAERLAALAGALGELGDQGGELPQVEQRAAIWGALDCDEEDAGGALGVKKSV
jgi:hypothetical protein